MDDPSTCSVERNAGSCIITKVLTQGLFAIVPTCVIEG